MKQKKYKERGWKRLLSLVLSLVMVFTLLPVGSVTTYAAGNTVNASSGSGTADNPYIISSSADLKSILSQDTTGKYYKLSDDFNNTEEITETLSGFYGNLDGNGKTVKLNISKPNNVHVGLFFQNSGIISNFTVKGCVLGYEDVGGICGENKGGTITNCINKASVTGNSLVGGISGENSYDTSSKKEGTIRNCQNDGEIIASDSYAGGITGKNGDYCSNASVEDCKNNGNVTCTPYKDYIGYADSKMAYKEYDGKYCVIGKVGSA